MANDSNMLFSPDYHEPLTESDWNEVWVRRRIDEIAADAESAVTGSGLWPLHPDDDEGGRMLKGVYMGAAGMIWGLHALGLDRPDLIRGLYESYVGEPDWPGLVPGYWGGEAGILLVSQLLDPRATGADQLEAAIRSNAGNESNELMWGAPGTMLVALAMHRRSGDQRWADAWLESAEQLWSRWLPADEPGCYLWTQLLYGDTARYVGPGHGFAGNAWALWLGRHLLDASRVAELERRVVATTTTLAVREGGLANWPPTVGPLAHRGRIRTQWCHGAPGMVTSLASIAATDDAFTALLVEAGELTWRAGPLAFGQGLCHGTAGNGLAFMALYERTGEADWLERARRFAVHALEQVAREREAHGTGRYSLWTGDIGAALMARSCIECRAGMPSLDWV
jgi:hypothetical protein